MITLMQLWKRDKGICQLCHHPCEMRHATRDHIIPVSHGGRDDAGNLRLAHKRCNRRRGKELTIKEMHAAAAYIRLGGTLKARRNNKNKSMRKAV